MALENVLKLWDGFYLNEDDINSVEVKHDEETGDISIEITYNGGSIATVEDLDDIVELMKLLPGYKQHRVTEGDRLFIDGEWATITHSHRGYLFWVAGKLEVLTSDDFTKAEHQTWLEKGKTYKGLDNDDYEFTGEFTGRINWSYKSYDNEDMDNFIRIVQLENGSRIAWVLEPTVEEVENVSTP
jgi:hypothetical protein